MLENGAVSHSYCHFLAVSFPRGLGSGTPEIAGSETEISRFTFPVGPPPAVVDKRGSCAGCERPNVVANGSVLRIIMPPKNRTAASCPLDIMPSLWEQNRDITGISHPPLPCNTDLMELGAGRRFPTRSSTVSGPCGMLGRSDWLLAAVGCKLLEESIIF